MYRFGFTVEAKDETLIVNGGIIIQVFSIKEPSLIPWGVCHVQTVAECSGTCLTTPKAEVII